jgi:hypothetical protein
MLATMVIWFELAVQRARCAQSDRWHSMEDDIKNAVASLAYKPARRV